MIFYFNFDEQSRLRGKQLAREERQKNSWDPERDGKRLADDLGSGEDSEVEIIPPDERVVKARKPIIRTPRPLKGGDARLTRIVAFMEDEPDAFEQMVIAHLTRGMQHRLK